MDSLTRSYRKSSALLACALGLLACLSPCSAQDAEPEPEEKKGFGAGLLGKIKESASDLKDAAPLDRVTGSLGDLKDAVVENIKSVDGLKDEIREIRDRLDLLENGQNELADSVANHEAALNEGPGKSVPAGSDTGIDSILATDLAAAYMEDPRAADKIYLNNFMEVMGKISGFRGGKDVTVLLKAQDPGSPPIACHFMRNPGFEVEVIDHEGRLANRADRTTYLQIGMPVKIQGTCTGFSHDIRLSNCKVVGEQPKKIVKEADKKRR